jgi:MFS family permease
MKGNDMFTDSFRSVRAPDREAAQPRPRKQRWLSLLGLVVVLIGQEILSLRLHNTVFLDEAGYLSAGRCQLDLWLHHGPPCEHYAQYFSGAPFLYPVLAAAADGHGGLATARGLSLVFMLLITVLVWGIAGRLFGRLAAFFAAAVFAASAPVLYLGHFATFDAAALCGLAFALWLVVRIGERRGWLLPVLAGLVLGLAVATKYAARAFVPSVIAIAGLLATSKIGPRAAAIRCVIIGAAAASVFGATLLIGGGQLLKGLTSTTTNRPSAQSSDASIIREFSELGLAVFVIALVGAAIYLYSERYEPDQPDGTRAVTGFILAGSALIAPLNQLHIHTTVSLHKHIAFGLMFAAPLAGLTLAWLAGGAWYRAALPGVVTVALVVTGATQSQTLFGKWPNSSVMVARLSSVISSPNQQILADGISVPRYYLSDRVPLRNWHNPGSSFTYTANGSTQTGMLAYQAAFAGHYFAAVVLNDEAQSPLNQQLIALMEANGYRELALIPTKTTGGTGTYSVWAPEPAPAPVQPKKARPKPAPKKPASKKKTAAALRGRIHPA